MPWDALSLDELTLLRADNPMIVSITLSHALSTRASQAMVYSSFYLMKVCLSCTLTRRAYTLARNWLSRKGSSLDSYRTGLFPEIIYQYPGNIQAGARSYWTSLQTFWILKSEGREFESHQLRCMGL